MKLNIIYIILLFFSLLNSRHYMLDVRHRPGYLLEPEKKKRKLMPGGGLAIVMDDADGPDDVGQDTCCADETSTTTRDENNFLFFPHLRKSRRRPFLTISTFKRIRRDGRTSSQRP